MTKSELDSVCELLTKYKFKTDIKNHEDLTCVICQGYLRNAHKSLCRCTYCFECFNSYVNKKETHCPGKVGNCTQQLDDVIEYMQFDEDRNERIRNIVVKCPLESCSFKDHLINMYRHINSHSNSPEPETQISSFNEASLLDLIRALQNEITKLKDVIARHSNEIKELNEKFEQSLHGTEPTRRHKKSLCSSCSKYNGFSQSSTGSTGAESIENISSKCDSQLAVIMTPRPNYQVTDSQATPVRPAPQLETGAVTAEPKCEPPSAKTSEKIEFIFSKILYDTKVESSNKSQSKPGDAVGTDEANPGNAGELEGQQAESPTKSKTFRRKLNRRPVTVGESKNQENEPPGSRAGEDQKKPVEYRPQETTELSLAIVEIENMKLVDTKPKGFQVDPSLCPSRRIITLANLPDGLASLAGEHGEERCPYDWEFRVSHSVLVEEGVVARVVSKPFFSHPGGYRLRLVVEPSATCLSVGFVVCRGPHNQTLPWPMRLDVVLSVLDQKTRKIHCSGIIFKQQALREPGVCTRPTRAQNEPCIYRNLVELKKIANNSRVFQNQCILIRCEVLAPFPC